MKNYGCPKCGSVDLFIKDNGNQKGLYCSEGCGWIKWVSKKELAIVEEFLNSNKPKDFKITNIDKLQGYYKQKKFELEIENNAYNRGVVKGMEIALKIMEVE